MKAWAGVAGFGAYCAVLAACTMWSGVFPVCNAGSDKAPAHLSREHARHGEHGWFLLDVGSGFQTSPILYRLDGGVLTGFVPGP